MDPSAQALALTEQALARRGFVKIISGLAATDGERARNLAFVYTLAGAHAIDVGAAPRVVAAARDGIAAALAWAERLGQPRPSPLLMVSVGLDRDPHVAAPLLDRAVCATCPGCTIVLLKECVDRPLDARYRECPSCYQCVDACPFGAIRLAPRAGFSPEALAAARDAGAGAVELHLSDVEPLEVLAAWRAVRAVFGEAVPVSFSLGSEVTSHDFVERQVEAIEGVRAPLVIIQAEGRPSSGRVGADGTGEEVRPSIALAERVLRSRPRAFVQVSGGADEHTGALLRALALPVAGVAFGSAARARLGPALSRPALDGDAPEFGPALAAARRLVDSVAAPAASIPGR